MFNSILHSKPLSDAVVVPSLHAAMFQVTSTPSHSHCPNLSSRQNPESRTSPVNNIAVWCHAHLNPTDKWWDCYTSFLPWHHIRAVLVLKGVD